MYQYGRLPLSISMVEMELKNSHGLNVKMSLSITVSPSISHIQKHWWVSFYDQNISKPQHFHAK